MQPCHPLSSKNTTKPFTFSYTNAVCVKVSQNADSHDDSFNWHITLPTLCQFSPCLYLPLQVLIDFLTLAFPDMLTCHTFSFVKDYLPVIPVLLPLTAHSLHGNGFSWRASSTSFFIKDYLPSVLVLSLPTDHSPPDKSLTWQATSPLYFGYLYLAPSLKYPRNTCSSNIIFTSWLQLCMICYLTVLLCQRLSSFGFCTWNSYETMIFLCMKFKTTK